MKHSVKAPDFWEAQWQAVADRSRVRRSNVDIPPEKRPGSVDRWNKMARDFADRIDKKKFIARREQTIGHLVDKGVLHGKTRVLDIGAGPGGWALPLAEICAHVTALEPARGMIDIMTDRIKAENVQNITAVQSTWQEVDLKARQWEGAFDLVFASMTPGIDGPSTFKKMMAASKEFCYMSAFSGSGMHQQYAPLWEKFFNGPMPERPSDIIYPFNLLYAMGYRPDLTFSWWDREISWDRDHTIRHFVSFFESHMEITPQAEAIIADYVDTRCQNGTYSPAHPVCRGTMIWSVQKKDGFPGGPPNDR